MKKLQQTFLWFLIIIAGASNLWAQTDQPDNKGKEFWIMFSKNFSTSNLFIFITSDVATSGTVEIPGISFTTTFSVTPEEITTIQLPSTAAVTSNDLIEKKGIHITAKQEVTVYGINQMQFSTDAFLALPINVLNEDKDSDYIIMSYTNLNSSITSEFGLVGTENNTKVTIIPSKNVPGHPSGVPFTINIGKGETYQLQATGSSTNDLTGTIVSSDKPIAVFGAHVCANVPPNTTFCDHIVEQLPPTTTWGEKFVTVPLATRLKGDIFRILSSTNNTKVEVKGIKGFTQSFTINRGEFRELDIPSNEYTEITSSNPILVAQFSKGDESDPTIVNGDPFMLLVPSLEQFLSAYTITTPKTGFTLNFVNIIAPKKAIGNITLDGSIIPASTFTAIGSSEFYAAQVDIKLGTHNLKGNAPFGVSIYGFANDESYGYLGGQAFGEITNVDKIELS